METHLPKKIVWQSSLHEPLRSQRDQSLRGTFKGNLSMWSSTVKRQVLRQRSAPSSSCACVVPGSASRAWVSVSNAALYARVTRRHQCMPASGVVLRIREGAGNNESFSPVQNQSHNAEKKESLCCPSEPAQCDGIKDSSFLLLSPFSTGGGFDIGRYGAIQAHQILQ